MTVISVPSTGGHGGTQTRVDLVVIHGTVGPTRPGYSVNIARYLNSIGLSVHEIVDPTTVAVMLPDHTIAYGDGHNTGHWQVELCDAQAGSAARWSDPDHTAMLTLAAGRVRAACQRLGVPMVRVQSPLVGKRGICGHGDVSRTWHESTHTDPDSGGPFPWALFLSMVNGQTDTPGDDMNEAQFTAYLASPAGKKALAEALLSASYYQPKDGTGAAVSVNDALTKLAAAVAKIQTKLGA